MTSGEFVQGVWVGASVVAALTIGYSVWRGLRDDIEGNAIRWRKVKVAGAAAGIVGLFAVMLTFERTIRELNQDSERYLMASFLELKFKTVAAAAIACSGDQSQQEARNVCFDFENLDHQVSFANLYSGQHFEKPVNWQKNEKLDPMIEDISRSFDALNSTIERAHEKPILSQEARAKFGIVAIVMVVTALACTIGEAVFQMRQERARRER
jgi:hypothetical protein